MVRREKRSARIVRIRACIRIAASLSVLACLPALSSCAKSGAVAPWTGAYAAEKGPEAPGIYEMSVDGLGKRDFSFFLRLVQDNGYSREISGKASFRGRLASYANDGVALEFRLEEGENPAIIMQERGAKSLEAEGFVTNLRLRRDTANAASDDAAAVSSAPEETDSAAGKGDSFRFGYYLPEGADADALPESLSFLFFDANGMVLRENAMFEGMMGEGRTIGDFSLSEGSIKVKSLDEKTGKKSESEWKREGRDVVVSDSGQRYFFWKGNLED